MTLRRCIYTESSVCQRHGGSGASHHHAAYVHPYHREDVPVSLQKSVETMDTLHIHAEDEYAHRVLSVGFHDRDQVIKGLFNFDLTTPEGVSSLLEILPIADDSIVQDVYASIWPSSSGTKTVDTKLLKLQIMGYLHDTKDVQEESAERDENDTASAAPDDTGE